MSDMPADTVTPVVPIQQRTTARVPTNNADGDTMERLFQALFYRIAVLYARAVPRHIRRLGESAILVMVIPFQRKQKPNVSSLGNRLFEFINLFTSCV